MKLKDEINEIERQTMEIRTARKEIEKIMTSFSKEVDEYLAKD